jgi:hypothetical protein
MTASPAAVAFAFAAAAVSLAAAFGTGWRATQLVALAGSALVFVEFLGWGYDESSQFWFVLSFALAFVALFTVSGFGAALFNRREPSSYDIGVTVAATLIFAPVAISLAADRSDTLDGFLPLFLALAYGAAAFWGYASAAPRLANLASLGLSAAFLATAVSLQLDGALVPILWAAEAALLALIARQTSEEAFGIFSGAMAFLALFAVADVNFPADAEPILNARFASLLAVLVAGWVLAAAARVVSRRPGKENWRGGFAVVAIASHLLALGVTANEVTVAYGPEIDEARDAYYGAQGGYVYTDGYGEYRDGDAALERASYQKLRKLESAQMTAIAIVWGLYGALILVIGFAVASAPSRYAGVGTLLLAAGDVFLIVWDLGTGYRIVASFTVGVLLLGGAYLFARYRHRITG